MHLLGAAQPAVVVAPGVGEAGILGEMNSEAEIAGHAHRGLHRVVGDDPGDDEIADASGAKLRLEIRADEGAVGLLGDHGLARQGHRLGLEVIARLARAIGGVRLTGIMADVE